MNNKNKNKNLSEQLDTLYDLITKIVESPKRSDLLPLAKRTLFDLKDQVRLFQNHDQENVDEISESDKILSARIGQCTRLYRKAALLVEQYNRKQEEEQRRMLLTDGEALLRRKGSQLEKTIENEFQSSKELTNSLKRTARLLDSEVQRGEGSLQTLIKSSEEIRLSLKENMGYEENIQRGRKLVTGLKRREFFDNIWLILASIFFVCTILFILYKRIF
ncbi:vesicle transport protein sec20 [Anaeramoeba flamelloides]|uniref:Vesicle transport protein sec20 n=1 Tax=Anaeramoeba flamelloides TaxID=1746091 RepID=A0ABQ8YX28_9EUKA|nr:vesicle transport protein sec20 [Anaeramoeba flamelloides]